jgi:hypothetical protein
MINAAELLAAHEALAAGGEPDALLARATRPAPDQAGEKGVSDSPPARQYPLAGQGRSFPLGRKQ